jgi:hypothetical protein
MDATHQSSALSKGSIWTGRVLSILVVLLLTFDAVLKLLKPQAVVEASSHLGLPLGLSVPIGMILLFCTLLYAIPQTSILGAILLTGYLGGAVLTHLRVGDPLASHILFPVYLGILLWLGLHLREGRLRSLVPLRTNS